MHSVVLKNAQTSLLVRFLLLLRLSFTSNRPKLRSFYYKDISLCLNLLEVPLLRRNFPRFLNQLGEATFCGRLTECLGRDQATEDEPTTSVDVSVCSAATCS